MLKQVNWSENRAYRTGAKHEPVEFYLNGIANAKKADLLLGYFSFATINLLSIGFAKFLYNGGKLRVVANNVLTPKDKDTIGMVSEIDDEDDELIDLTDIEKLANRLNEYGTHFFRCIAWLIKKGRIEILLVRPKGKMGVSHYKSGVFYDDEHQVGFKASCNFTPYGMLENLEEVDVFLSWENSRSSKAIKSQQEYFEEIIEKKNDAVEYVSFDEIETSIRNKFGSAELEELIKSEKELIELKKKSYLKKSYSETLEIIGEEIALIANEPKFPFNSKPRDYQIEAYNNWLENDMHGIFAMATGTGKTITSLNCALEVYKKQKSYQILILVPTNDLLNQWVDEVKSFNFREVMAVSSKTDDERKLASLSAEFTFGSNRNFVIITTYATFVRSKFQQYIKSLPKETLLIADEAHNVGANQVKQAFKNLTFNRRIALSATPKRKYDLEGSKQMEGFFKDSVPYTYTYSMEKAIEKGVLCHYDYYPVLVRLNDDEFERYQEITIQLMKFFDAETGRFKESEIVNALLLKRKRVIHKASNKLAAFRSILKKEFKKRGSLKYTFVYVPEGLDIEDSEKRIIADYNNAAMQIDESIRVAAYLGGTPNKKGILESFSQGEIDLLTSMKCLDEGVDVPRTETAIFCSSTGNPRQFIQRRGRVLRKHTDKQKATVYDLVVVPNMTEDENTSIFRLERSMLRNELERVVHFAFMAMNIYEVIDTFKPICDYYKLDIYEIKDALND
jgi:superfamily II DNA or RNA helicase